MADKETPKETMRLAPHEIEGIIGDQHLDVFVYMHGLDIFQDKLIDKVLAALGNGGLELPLKTYKLGSIPKSWQDAARNQLKDDLAICQPIVAALQAENRELKEQLKAYQIAFQISDNDLSVRNDWLEAENTKLTDENTALKAEIEEQKNIITAMQIHEGQETFQMNLKYAKQGKKIDRLKKKIEKLKTTAYSMIAYVGAANYDERITEARRKIDAASEEED